MSNLRVVGVETGACVQVVVEGPDVLSVNNAEARGLAIKEAMARGFQRCGVSGSSGPYVVDDEGNDVVADTDASRMLRESQLLRDGRGRYRNRFKVQPSLG